MPNNREFIFKLLTLIGIILFGLFGGSLGYMYFEGWSFFDSLYMTVITTTTVGFHEVSDLSFEGRVFTIFLIFFSVGTFAYAISSLTLYATNGEYRKYINNYKQLKQFKRMENHVVICGFGRVGKQVAEDLISHNIPVLVIENSKEIIEKHRHSKILFIEGDASQDEVIKQVNINAARAVICCLPKDAENLYAILAVKEICNETIIISRASNQQAISKLKRAGATHVIMPDVIGGSHIASLISSPDVMEFMENIKSEDVEGVNIKSISYEELPTEFQDKTIQELEEKKITGVRIIGYKTADGEYIINPNFQLVVVPNSKLFVLGNSEQIKLFITKFHLN